jgi:hypothetical protein
MELMFKMADYVNSECLQIKALGTDQLDKVK